MLRSRFICSIIFALLVCMAVSYTLSGQSPFPWQNPRPRVTPNTIKPRPAATPTAVPSPTATATPRPTATVTPTVTPTSTPSATPRPTATATVAPIQTPTPAPTPAIGAPALPQVYLDTSYPVQIGRTFTVTSGGDVQAALNLAQPGDTVALQAGAMFYGNFVLPAKFGTGWIVITTTNPTGLPAVGTRVGPEHAGAMPKIITPTVEAAIRTMPGAHHWRLVGLDIAVQPGLTMNYGIVTLGDGSGAQNTLAQVPSDLVIDRCLIRGNTTGNVTRGVALNSTHTAIVDSHISEIHALGFDTQAICGWNGPGPYKIVNNYLEASGENVMFGGSNAHIVGLVPSDVEMRRNHLFKPLSWREGDPSYAGAPWTVKNLFELKNARRVLVEGNVMENNWQHAQNGFALLFTVRVEDGWMPWAAVEDITFAHNIIRKVPAGFIFLGRDYNGQGVTRRILVRNNLVEQVGLPMGGNARMLQIGDGAQDVAFDHNTLTHSSAGHGVLAYGTPSPGFTFTNNATTGFGLCGDVVGCGQVVIDTYFPGGVVTGNAFIGVLPKSYPTGNFYPGTGAALPAGVGADDGALQAAQVRP